MSEKKALKKELKICKKQIRYSNYAVRGFMKGQHYQKGSYRILQLTSIWSEAKNQLLHYHEIKYQQLVCFKCGQQIKSNPILHHKKYNWKHLFTPRYIGFTHRKCHIEVHATKRGYKRSLSYYEMRCLIALIAAVVFFIVSFVISS